jgi:hypothetical protein
MTGLFAPMVGRKSFLTVFLDPVTADALWRSCLWILFDLMLFNPVGIR